MSIIRPYARLLAALRRCRPLSPLLAASLLLAPPAHADNQAAPPEPAPGQLPGSAPPPAAPADTAGSATAPGSAAPGATPAQDTGSAAAMPPPAGTPAGDAAAATPDSACVATPYAALSPPAALREHPDFSPYAGLTIGAVHLSRLDVFDESNRHENHFLYRLLNDAHVTSREGTIRRQLLFAPGDRLVPRILDETGRNLRQNNYLADARVLPLQVCGDRVDLVVVTRDTWSLEPGASFSHSGGKSNSGFTLKDTNLLGTGHSIAVDFSHTPERNSIDYELDANNLFGAARINVAMRYSDTSDGSKESLSVTRPFFALDTRRSGGAFWSHEARIDTITSGGVITDRFGHDINQYTLFGGYSPGLVDSYTNRYTLGITREEDLFRVVDSTYPDIPEDRTLTYPWVGFERTENRFAIYNNIDFINRTEDIPLGKHMSTTVGWGPRGLGNPVPQMRFSGLYSDAPDLGRHHLLRVEGHVAGGWMMDAGDFENTVAGATATYHYLHGEKTRLFARLSMDAGAGTTADKLLTIGGISDMRGYPLAFESGDRRYVLNLEHRYYSSLHLLNLVRLGTVVFADAGQAWDSHAGGGISPVYDVGAGLRLSSSKAHVGRVLHMDFALPLNDRDRIPHWQWSLKVLESF